MRIISICDPNRAQPSALRYQISFIGGSGPGRQLAVTDRYNNLQIARWEDVSARQLIAHGALPQDLRLGARFLMDKYFVHHLLLAAAALLETDRSCGHARLRDRLQTLGVELSESAMVVARLMFAQPTWHFTAFDVECLLHLERRPIADSLDSILNELTNAQIVARIVVDADNVFYDTVSRPHLHLFDAISGTLRDAPATGVVAGNYLEKVAISRSTAVA